MTPVLIAAAATLASLALALLVTLVARKDRRRYTAAATSLEQWNLHLDTGREAEYLRHPAHRPRCQCGRYGLPHGKTRYQGQYVDHTRQGCWPPGGDQLDID